jgi:predicted metal-dependent peptidase
MNLDNVVEQEEVQDEVKEEKKEPTYASVEIPYAEVFRKDFEEEFKAFEKKYPVLLSKDEMDKLISKIKLIITVNFRFYSILLDALKTKFEKTRSFNVVYNQDTGEIVEVYLGMRAATDFTNIIWNEHFFSNISTPNRIFVYLHEVLHCALLHMARVNTSPIFKAFRELKKELEDLLKKDDIDEKEVGKLTWKIKKGFRKINIALDHPINISLKDDARAKSNLIQLVEDCCLDEKFRGMSAEEVYAELIKEKPPGEEDSESDSFGDDDSFDNHEHMFNGSSEKFKEAMRKWDNVIRKAVMNARMSGEKLSGGAELIVKEYDKRNSRVRYTQILQQAIINEFKREVTRRPNRRYLPHGIYIESMKSNTIEIVFMCDTSGSRFEELHETVREVLSIVASFNSYRIHYYAVDTAIAHYEVFDITNPITVEKLQKATKGGGGTSFVSWLEHLDKIRNRFPVLAVTDMEADFPEKTNQNIFWLVPERFERNIQNCPYGRGLVI